MNTYRHVISIVALLFAFSLAAQKVASVSGKYTLILGDNENTTIREARLTALEMAKAEAIKEKFGSMVASDQIWSEMAVNERESSIFMTETQTSVRGEWLGDEREPKVTIETDGENIMFTAQVWGKAREIIRGTTDIKWQVMKGQPGSRAETASFKSGERIYVNFTSPIDGYAALYLVSDDGSTSCLLPYPKDPTGQFKVKHGTTYTFFDKETDSDRWVKYYKLNTDKLQEYNLLYLIFSPNPFTKCADYRTNANTPNQLNQKDFAKWLLNMQRADKDMVVARKWLQIQSE